VEHLEDLDLVRAVRARAFTPQPDARLPILRCAADVLGVLRELRSKVPAVRLAPHHDPGPVDRFEVRIADEVFGWDGEEARRTLVAKALEPRDFGLLWRFGQ
jgi:hypothetical protein